MTPLLRWSGKLAIDNQPLLDEQHQQLFEQVNRLWALLMESHNRNEVIALVDALQNQTRAHFQHEEQSFHLLEEKEAMLHRIHHKHLLEAMQGLYQFITTNEPIPVHNTIERLQEIAEWYQSHVLHSDSKLLIRR